MVTFVFAVRSAAVLLTGQLVAVSSAARISEGQSAAQGMSMDEQAQTSQVESRPMRSRSFEHLDQAGNMTCKIKGPDGEVVQFPVHKCHTECVKATSWKGYDSNTVKHFSLLFDVAFEEDNDNCVCSIGGRPTLQFRSISPRQQKECSTNTVDAKVECWEMYKRARATHIEVEEIAKGDYRPIAYRIPGKYFEVAFHVEKTCQSCTGKDCYGLVMPNLLAGLGKVALGIVADAFDTSGRRGSGRGLSRPLQEFSDVLVASDKDALEFHLIDKDGNGKLDRKELHEHFEGLSESELDLLLEEIQASSPDGIDVEEFKKFKEAMRKNAEAFRFARIDQDHTGIVSREQLSVAYPAFTESQIDYFMTVANVPDDSNSIDFEHFKNVLKAIEDYDPNVEIPQKQKPVAVKNEDSGVLHVDGYSPPRRKKKALFGRKKKQQETTTPAPEAPEEGAARRRRRRRDWKDQRTHRSDAEGSDNADGTERSSGRLNAAVAESAEAAPAEAALKKQADLLQAAAGEWENAKIATERAANAAQRAKHATAKAKAKSESLQKELTDPLPAGVAAWQPSAVKCMKDGEEADSSECSGSADDAVTFLLQYVPALVKFLVG